ncbi:RNA recognition motif 2 protein [Toxoplasma gondii ARI]|uniref:RNA recognition motif 2 protein n=1 Tax=Toxoplasma gondii ARI TaxID=1074872 RepID=A0A139XTF2_TOXGO|nr:RNA recognition motif 2 protein [Toxoplasma gondii ARI]
MEPGELIVHRTILPPLPTPAAPPRNGEAAASPLKETRRQEAESQETQGQPCNLEGQESTEAGETAKGEQKDVSSSLPSTSPTSGVPGDKDAPKSFAVVGARDSEVRNAEAAAAFVAADSSSHSSKGSDAKTAETDAERCPHASSCVGNSGGERAAPVRDSAGGKASSTAQQNARDPPRGLPQGEESVAPLASVERQDGPTDQRTGKQPEHARGIQKDDASLSCEERPQCVATETPRKASGEEQQDVKDDQTVEESGRKRQDGLVQLGSCCPAAELGSQEDLSGGLTTVMLRNIPNKYTQEMMISLLNETYKGLFDFFYLPIDFRNSCNVGYCFINFVHPFVAVHFKRAFHNLKLTAFKSQKVCACTWGRVQGLQANIAHYRNSAVMGVPFSQYKPLLFRDGLIIPFPQAKRPLPSVKPRGHHERGAKVS